MSAADWWRVGFAADFAKDIHRISQSLADLVEEAKLRRGLQQTRPRVAQSFMHSERLLDYAHAHGDEEAERWLQELIAAAEDVGEKWETGDLAGAVSHLLGYVSTEDAHASDVQP